VSANVGVGPVEFDNLNPTYSTAFQTFSPQRLFTSLGSNVMDVSFFVPGSTSPASTSAFGAVFTDVDLANTTRIEFFDPFGDLLAERFVPAGTVADKSLSFLGVVFNAGEEIARVRITTGTDPLASGTNDNPAAGIDLVVMDDFLYREPQALQAIPEPASWTLLAGGTLALFGLRRRWKRDRKMVTAR